MRISVRLTLAISVFVVAAITATLLLGNLLSSPCQTKAGWTGYAPLTQCGGRQFWAWAILIGPVVGAVAAAGAGLVLRRQR